MAQKKKTDRPGIIASMKHLSDIGYVDVENIHHPADLRATKDGETYWFEVKYTESVDKAFGAATMTEWQCALEHPEHFFFLIANKPDGEDADTEWKFDFIIPSDFMPYSTIPPFKVYFNYPLQGIGKVPERKSAIPATEENLRSLIKVLDDLRDD